MQQNITNCVLCCPLFAVAYDLFGNSCFEFYLPSTHQELNSELAFVLHAGGRREIRLQVCVRPRGTLLHGVPGQPTASTEDWRGAADQRGGHGAAVPLWREHGLRPGGALLSTTPLQRRICLLTKQTHTHTHTHIHPDTPFSSYTWDLCHLIQLALRERERDWHTHQTELPLCVTPITRSCLTSLVGPTTLAPCSRMQSALYRLERHQVDLLLVTFVQ